MLMWNTHCRMAFPHPNSPRTRCVLGAACRHAMHAEEESEMKRALATGAQLRARSATSRNGTLLHLFVALVRIGVVVGSRRNSVAHAAVLVVSVSE